MAEKTSQTIDTLELQITASAKGTTAAFELLERKLDILQKAINSIDLTKIKQLNSAVKAAKPKIDTSGMSTAERNIKASVEKIQQSLAGLTAYANKSLTGDKSAFSSYEKQATSLQSAIDVMKEKFKQLGNQAVPTKAYEKIQMAIEDTKSHLDSLKAKEQETWDSGGANKSAYEVIQLGFAIQETDAKLKALEEKQARLLNENKAFYNPFKEYETAIINAEKGLKDMTSQVNTAMSAMQNQPGDTAFDKLSEKLGKEIPMDISKLQTSLAGLNSIANSAMNGDKSSFTSFERKVITIQGEVDKLNEKLRQLGQSGNISDAAISQYKSQIDSVQASLNGMAEKVKDAFDQKSGGETSDGLKDVKKQADKAHSSVSKLGNAIKKILGAEVKGIVKLSAAFTGLGKVSNGTFNSSFMKLLKYGFGIRSIYVLFRRLRKAVVESFKELQNSGAFVEETKNNIQELKEQLAVLKYQFGAAFQPIFNAVAPALKTLMSNLISVMNTISAFIAKLMGKSTYSKAVVNAAAFADNTGKAAKAQKELNKQLQGFDELNNLTTNNNNGGSGSSGSSDDIPGAVYVTESVDNALGDFWKELAKKIQSGNWKEVGSAISQKLSDALDSIPWTDIFEKVGNFGHNLAEFLNGLITPEVFGKIGTTIGNVINTSLIFFKEWGKGMNWENVGKALSDGFEAFIKTGWLGNLGETLHIWIGGALDALTTFFDETDFEEVGKAIAEFIGNLNIPDLAQKLMKLAIKILEALADAIKGLWNNSSITGKLAMALIGLFGVLKLTGLAKTFAGLIGSAIAGQTITVAASGTTVTLTGVQLILSGVAAVAAGALMYSAGTSADRVQNNPFEFDRDTGASDWANMGAQWLKGTGSISSLAGAAALLKGGKFWSTFGSTFAKIAPATALWTAGPYLSNNFGKYFADDPETQKYYDEYQGSYSMFETKKTEDSIKNLYRAAKEGNLLPGLLNLGFAQAKSLRNLTVGNETTKHNNWMENLYYDAKYHISDFAERWADASEDWFGPVIEFFDPNSGYMKDLGGIIKEKAKSDVQPVKDIAKAGWDALQNFGDKVVNGAVNIGAKVKNMYKGSYLEEGVNTLKSIFGGDSLGGTNMLNAWNGFSESISKANVSYKSMGETAKNLVEKTKTLVSDTKDFGTEASNSASKAKTGFASFATDTISTFSDAYTKGTKTWNGIGRWATTKATDASKGFDSFSGAVSGKFDDAYTQSTNKWLGISSWANDVTTKTTTGMSQLPSNVAKTFGDAYTDGTNKWSELGTWATTQGDTVDNAFNNFPTKTETQFGNAYTNGTTKWDGIGKWASDTFSKVSETSSRKLGEVASQFETNFNNGTNKAQSRVSVFSSFLNSLNLVKKTGVESDESAFQRVKNRFEGFKTSLNQNKNVTIAVEGRGFDTLGSKITSLVGQLRNLKNMSGGITLGYNTGVNNFRYFAAGGVVGGATPAIVGEAGPEAILPLTDGTIGKLADMIVGNMVTPQMPMINNSSINGYGTTNTGSSDIARQNELLAEQNQLLRQIAAKELTVSSKDVFNATRSEANNYYNRTGNSPFLI